MCVKEGKEGSKKAERKEQTDTDPGVGTEAQTCRHTYTHSDGYTDVYTKTCRHAYDNDDEIRVVKMWSPRGALRGPLAVSQPELHVLPLFG